jgi:acyl-CoA thioester hydrolase
MKLHTYSPNVDRSGNDKGYRHDVVLHDADIDTLGHVNNVVYLRWTQEAAEAHWSKLASAAQQSGIAWIVLRHEIDYKQAAKPGDSVYALTWVGETEGVRSVRHVQIFRLPGILLAEAKTTWVLVDADTQRPKRISAEVLELLSR